MNINIPHFRVGPKSLQNRKFGSNSTQPTDGTNPHPSLVAGWYSVYTRSIRRRTEANEHWDGTHYQSEYLVPGRANHRTRLQHRQRCHVTSTQVNVHFECLWVSYSYMLHDAFIYRTDRSI